MTTANGGVLSGAFVQKIDLIFLGDLNLTNGLNVIDLCCRVHQSQIGSL